MIVVFCSRLVVFKLFPEPSLCFEFDTYWSDYPLFHAVSTRDALFIALCTRIKGQLQCIAIPHHFDPAFKSIHTNMINAHHSAIACLALSHDGKSLATASRKGTLVRVFDFKSGVLTHELRRGTDPADIYAIAYDPTNTRLAVASDKGTLHLFLLTPPSQETSNTKSVLHPMTPYLPKYFSSEWSFAAMSLPSSSRCVVAFSQQDPSRLFVVCSDGGFYTFKYDIERGKYGSMESFYKFFDMCE